MTSLEQLSFDNKGMIVITKMKYPKYLKILFGIALKELQEVSLNINDEKMYISELSQISACGIAIDLLKSNFVSYECKHPINAKMNVPSLNKIFKQINDYELITLYASITDNRHIFGIMVENEKESETRNYSIDMLESEDKDDIEVPELQYRIHMPSQSLKSIMESLKTVDGEVGRLTFNKQYNTLEFYTKGKNGSFTVKRYGSNTKDSFDVECGENTNLYDNIILYFKIQKAIDFTKCYNLSKIVTLGITHDHDYIVLEYDIVDMGIARFLIGTEYPPSDWS